MGVAEKFAEHFISNWPQLSLWLIFIVIGMLFIVSPFLIYSIFTERFNKGRYIFEKKGHGGAGNSSVEMLYMLDTMKGRLYSVDGNARYKRMHEYDWKEAREGKEH